MKKLINAIKNKLNKAVISAKTTLTATTAEGYVDTGVKIIIGVVIGGVILAGLYALFNTTIIPTLTTKIGNMFKATPHRKVLRGRSQSSIIIKA